MTAGDELPVSQAVLETVADAAACDTTDLEPLYRAIDPEALDAVLAPRPSGDSGPVGVAFTYDDYRVTVERGDENTVAVAVSETTEMD